MDVSLINYAKFPDLALLKTSPIYSRASFWVNYNELTTSSLEIIVSKGNHPQMAQQFRLVNYYNLPRSLMPWRFPSWCSAQRQALTSVLAFDRFDASLREALRPLLERRGVSSLAVLGAVSDSGESQCRKMMGKWWENDGKMMGKWWENDGKMMGKIDLPSGNLTITMLFMGKTTTFRLGHGFNSKLLVYQRVYRFDRNLWSLDLSLMDRSKQKDQRILQAMTSMAGPASGNASDSAVRRWAARWWHQRNQWKYPCWLVIVKSSIMFYILPGYWKL